MRKALILIICLSTLISCKKEYKVFEKSSDYTKLETGNYWIYKVSMFNSTRTDSVVITGDSLIDGKKYAITEGPDFTGDWAVLSLLRDSSNYIVNELGEIQFTTSLFNGKLHQRNIINGGTDSIVSIVYRMQESANIKVGAVTYQNVLNYQGEMFSFLEPPSANIKYDNNYYAKGVGLIKSEQNFASGNDPIVKKLVRYKVN